MPLTRHGLKTDPGDANKPKMMTVWTLIKRAGSEHRIESAKWLKREGQIFWGPP